MHAWIDYVFVCLNLSVFLREHITISVFLFLFCRFLACLVITHVQSRSISCVKCDCCAQMGAIRFIYVYIIEIYILDIVYNIVKRRRLQQQVSCMLYMLLLLLVKCILITQSLTFLSLSISDAHSFIARALSLLLSRSRCVRVCACHILLLLLLFVIQFRIAKNNITQKLYARIELANGSQPVYELQWMVTSEWVSRYEFLWL